MINVDYIENELIKLQKKAIKHNEVPVSALIVCNNKVISKAYNKVEHKNDIMKHAEIIVIKKAMKKKNNWRLDDCTLYVSLEPCDMCKQIIKKSRIKKVYYFSKQNYDKTENYPVYEYINNKDMSDCMTNFFKERR